MDENPARFGTLEFYPIDLRPHFRLRAVVTADRPADGTLDGQFGLAAEELPAPGRVNLLGIEFDFLGTGKSEPDCLVPSDQEVRLTVPRAPVVPRASCTPADGREGGGEDTGRDENSLEGGVSVRGDALFLLGTSVMGSSGSELTLKLTEDDRAEAARGRVHEGDDENEVDATVKEIVRFTDWCHRPQFGEREAIRAGYRYNGAGRVAQPNSIWLQVVFLPPRTTLRSIVFGHSPNMRIFAATLARGSCCLPANSLLHYLLVRLAEHNDAAALFSSLYYTLRDIAELRCDSALAGRLDAVRDGVLRELSVQDLFSGNREKTTDVFQHLHPQLVQAERDAAQRLANTPSASSLRITLVGHSHLDAVWLWPWNDTVGKAHRTFSRNLERMERFPGVTFAQSCPLFYEWMERYYPEVFRKIHAQIEAGRWELLGGMWVEPDGNMPCGEALVRQRLFGQRYYLERFGRLSEVAWIPDTFGMHANHPQIIAKTGGKYFFTTKLMWNYENVFPFQHFIWESPDGSRVLALQSAVGCGAEPGPYEWLEKSVHRHNPLLKPGHTVRVNAAAPHIPDSALSAGEFVPEVLCIFGEGDGGEGPSERMYQRAHTLSMLPEYNHGRVHDHFRDVESRYGDRLPVWNDELYLENHRGTTTSQGRIKELNRRAEASILAAEKWATLAECLARAGYARAGCAHVDCASSSARPAMNTSPPSRSLETSAARCEALAFKPRLDEAWKKLLYNQFHDILPGTSIPQVYVDAELDFERILSTTTQIESMALDSLARRIDTLPAPTSIEALGDDERFPTGLPLILFNPLGWERDETVMVPFGYTGVAVAGRDGRALPSQVVFRDGLNWLLFHVTVPSFGYTQVRLLGVQPPDMPYLPYEKRPGADTSNMPDAQENAVNIDAQRRTMENRFYRLELAPNGNIAEIYDKQLRRNLLAGEANDVRFFKNHPDEWSNWNLDPDYAKHELRPAGDDAVSTAEPTGITVGSTSAASIEVIDRGPVMAAFRVTKGAAREGRIVQEIRLFRDDRRIDFVTTVDVRFVESLVKAFFPFDVGGADHVTTDIAYGTYERPTRPRTPFEKAKWEVWTQKWLDMSGPAGGVTVLTRSRYGFDVRDEQIGLTLVKGGIMPDPTTDIGTHRIEYALFPHSGDFRAAHAWRRGYEYNLPVAASMEENHPGDLPSESSFISLSDEGVCFEAFKEAEEGRGLVIRVYEVEGLDRERVELTLPIDVASAEEVDFLELQVVRSVAHEHNRIVFPIGHHEIKAIRVFPVVESNHSPCSREDREGAPGTDESTQKP